MKSTNVILFGCHDKKLYCLEGSADTVSLRWTRELDSSVFSTPFVFPVISPEVNEDDETKLGTSNSDKQNVTYLATVASTKGKVYVLDLDFGVVKCSYQLPGEVFSSAIVHGNNIYIGCRDNHIYSLAMTVTN
jgi:outer membrane protein assembly factor BamB